MSRKVLSLSRGTGSIEIRLFVFLLGPKVTQGSSEEKRRRTSVCRVHVTAGASSAAFSQYVRI